MAIRDVVTNFIRRLGMVGAIVVASALILGAVVGGAVVHRVDTTEAASSEQAQGDESGPNAGDKPEKSNAAKNKHANNGDGQKKAAEPQESED